MVTRAELENIVEQVLSQGVERLLAAIPYARHLVDDREPLNEAYYLRHRIETVKRIRLTSKTDALALARMIDEDYEAARLWSRYTAEELSHDLLYLKDLGEHGYTAEMVASVAPLVATERLIDYLTRQIAEVGSLAAVAYSICAEWNSERVSELVVERAERAFSEQHVVGSRVHTKIDEREDHYAMMLDVAHRLMPVGSDGDVLVQLLQNVLALIGDYLNELYELAVVRAQAVAPGGAPRRAFA